METFNTNEKSLLRIAEALENFSAEKIGDLTNLDTEAKDNLVAAINELSGIIKSRIPEGVTLEIDDTWLNRELTEEEILAVQNSLMIILKRDGASMSYVNTCPNEILLDALHQYTSDLLEEDEELQDIDHISLADHSWSKESSGIVMNACEVVFMIYYTKDGHGKSKLIQYSL